MTDKILDYKQINPESIVFEPPKKVKGGSYMAEIKYRNSGLQEAEAQLHLQKLLKFMEESKPYLEQDLSLFKLSEEMQLSPNHLSQIINSLRQQNFFDFINAYRV